MPYFWQLAINPKLKIQQFPLVCWFWFKNLSNFVLPTWKSHNPYCHTVTIWHYLCSNCRPWNSKKLIVEQRIIQVKVRFCKEAMKTWWNLPLLLWLYYYTHVASRKQNWKISSCFFLEIHEYELYTTNLFTYANQIFSLFLKYFF